MNILFLSQRFLLPMDTGGKIRTGKILEKLSRRHALTVVGNYDPALDAPHRATMEAMCRRYVPVPWREPVRGSMGFYLRLARNLLSTHPVTALNDYSAALEQALLDELARERYDLAVCDFVQSALLFRRVQGLPRLLFQHNVEARICERHVRNAGNPLSRAFWQVQFDRMRRFEGNMVRSFDSVVAVSANDAENFISEYGARNVHAIPTGVDLDFYTSRTTAARDSGNIVFCGSMDWLPNEDGIRYFLDEIAPHLDRLRPGWKLTVVGRNPSETLRAAAARAGRVELTGWVDDVRPYLDAAAVCIVPLRIGGGTRMKIYEAMAMGRAVVSTSVGAEGLEVRDGVDIRLVDEPAAFAAAVAGLLDDADARDRMGAAARALVEAHFGWERVAEVFADLCADAVAGWRPAGPLPPAAAS